LRDLLERSLTEETPEDVAAMLPDEGSDEEGDDDYGTEEDDIYGTDEDDLNENRSYSFRTINEATTGQNLALGAGLLGGLMGFGGGEAQAQSTQSSPSQIPHLMNKDMASAKARMSSKKPQMTAKQLEAMMDQLDADQKAREDQMSHHEKLILRIQRAREARGEKPPEPDYKRLMGAIGDEGSSGGTPSGSANRSGESAIERSMRMARRFAYPTPAPEYKIGEGPAERNPDGTVNQEVTDIFKEIGPQMGRIEQERKARMQERYKQAERFLPK
jgi:hypothetical protein